MCPAGPLPPEKRLIVTSFLIIRRCFKLIPFWPSNFPLQPFWFNWTWYIASSQFTIYFVSTASPALPVQLCPSPIPGWDRFLINCDLNQKKKNFSSASVGENVSHAVLPLCTMPSCLFLSTGCKFGRRYMICMSECVSKLLYKQSNMNFLVTLCCMWRCEEIDYSLVNVN